MTKYTHELQLEISGPNQGNIRTMNYHCSDMLSSYGIDQYNPGGYFHSVLLIASVGSDICLFVKVIYGEMLVEMLICYSLTREIRSIVI